MPIKKGLSSLVNISPNFSNQALENSVYDIKAVDKDDGYLWIKSAFDMDTAIHDNTVLTTTQKNDALETLYNAQPHLQIGRYLNDVIRHTKSIIDGSILPEDGTFQEILSGAQSLQSLIPLLYGGTAKDKSRSINDHIGTLNNIFITTEDSTAPVFTRLKEIMQLIDTTARVNSGLQTGSAAVRYSNSQLVIFLSTIVADSTDFQETLDNRVNQAAGNMANLNTQIGNEIPGEVIEQLVGIKDEITDQVSLENTNIVTLRDYIQSLIDVQNYAGMGSDDEMAKLLSNVAQAPEWVNYYKTYKENFAALNPIYTAKSDSDKESMINDIYTGAGLPDVKDHLDLVAVSEKAKRDSRINTEGFDKLTIQEIITKSCQQLKIPIENKIIYTQSELLLDNMDAEDRNSISRALDLNESVDTLS